MEKQKGIMTKGSGRSAAFFLCLHPVLAILISIMYNSFDKGIFEDRKEVDHGYSFV